MRKAASAAFPVPAEDAAVRGGDGKPISISGLRGIASGNGGLARSRTTLYFASGPHRWRGATEQDVHGLLGSITLR